jgi:hypothetical protein
MNLIVDLQYFPSVNLFKILNKSSNIVFEQYEFFHKMSFRNRCQVAGAEGIINLSVPLQKGRDQRTLVKDVKIAGKDDWQGQHWKTLLSCYSRSPWFEFYRDDLAVLYRQPVHFLVDWNLKCFEYVCRVLPLKPEVGLTDSYTGTYDENTWADWRGKIVPRNRAESPVIKYHQVFEERIGFLPNLSILDLLFCEGRAARSYLE